MSRIVRAVITAALLAFAFSSGSLSASAASNESCSAPVVDQTKAHVLDQSTVNAAIQAADQAGLDLYVRAFQTVPDGSLDAYWQQTVPTCPNWRVGTGSEVRPKGNIVMVAFSLDHKSAIFYGSAYDSTIGDAAATEIRTQMGSYFRDGDFTGGVAYAATALEAQVSGAGTVTTSNNDQPKAATSDPTDWSVVGWILLWLLVCVLLIAAVILVVVMVFQLRKRQEELRGARKTALENKQAATRLYVEWDSKQPFEELEAAYVLSDLPANLRGRHERELESLKESVHAGQMAYEAVRTQDGGSKRLTSAEYTNLARRYEGVRAQLYQAKIDLNSAMQSVTSDAESYSYDGQTKRLQAIEALRSQVGSNLDRCGSIFDVKKERAELNKLGTSIEMARMLIESRHKQEDSHTLLLQMEATAASLLERSESMVADAAKLANPLQAMQQTVSKGRSRLDAYHNIDTTKAEAALNQLGLSLSSRLAMFSPNKARESQLSVLNEVTTEVNRIVGKVSDAEDKRRRKEDEEARRRARARERSSYGSSSSSDAFTGGVIGGVLGSSFGSSGSSSGGGFDFGGGSSGGWGGGGDAGGGSSGGW